MKNYLKVTPETLFKLSQSFASEELPTFMSHVAELTDELMFQNLLIHRVSELEGISIIMKQICLLTIFYREHYELFTQLLSKLETEPMTEEEIEELNGQ